MNRLFSHQEFLWSLCKSNIRQFQQHIESASDEQLKVIIECVINTRLKPLLLERLKNVWLNKS